MYPILGIHNGNKTKSNEYYYDLYERQNLFIHNTYTNTQGKQNMDGSLADWINERQIGKVENRIKGQQYM